MLKTLESMYSFLEKHDLSQGWITAAIVFAIIIIPLATLAINALKWRSDKKKVDLESFLADRSKKQITTEEINKKLTEFYLPLRYFLNQSKMLYDIFALEEKKELAKEGKRFNTIRHLCNGKKFSEKDQLILSEIIKIGEKQNNIIEEKNWCTDNNTLSELLSKYSAHLKILKLANEEDKIRDENLYKAYIFPSELPGAIESQILRLIDEKDSLTKIYKKNRKKTIKKYEDNALEYYKETISLDEGEDLNNFKKKIKSGGFVCDLGCGSGRDSINLIKSGFRVYSTEPSSKLAQLARTYPFIFVKEESLLEMKHPGRFDAIWCSAVLQHIPSNLLSDAIQNMANMLVKGGILYVSYRSTISFKEEIYANMYKHEKEKVKNLLASSGLTIEETKEEKSRKKDSNRFISFLSIKK